MLTIAATLVAMVIGMNAQAVEFVGPGHEWDLGSNWDTGVVPRAYQDVVIRRGHSVSSTSSLSEDVVQSLYVGQDSSFSVGLGVDQISMTDSTIITDSGRIVVRSNGQLNSSDLHANGGLLWMLGGEVEIDNELQISNYDNLGRDRGDGQLFGYGTITVNGSLINNNFIYASGGTLQFESTAANPWDLDGDRFTGLLNPFAENGQVFAQGGNIQFASGGMADAFDGSMVVGFGGAGDVRFISFAEDWTLGQAGSLTLIGDDDNTYAHRAEITGNGALTVQGTIDAYQYTRLDTNITFESTAQVVLHGEDTKLELGNGLGSVVYKGGSYIGEGRLVQNNDATIDIARDVTIDLDMETGQYDWDGYRDASSTTLRAGSSLTINASRLETDGAFNGTANIYSANLSVNVADDNWLLGSDTDGGTLNLHDLHSAAWGVPVISGDKLTVGALGVINVHGAAEIKSQIDISGTVEFADTDAKLTLGGGSASDPDRMSGGTIDGATSGIWGTLVSSGDHSLHGYGTIDAYIEFAEDANLFADGGTLHLNRDVYDVARIGTAREGAVIDFGATFSTSNADWLDLNGGQVTGTSITNDGLTVGHGQITVADWNNSGTATASGGLLVVNINSNIDLDGGTGNGVWNALDGSIDIRPTAFTYSRFNGTINIADGHTFQISNGDLSNDTGTNPGEIHMNGGTLSVSDFTNHSILTNNSAPATLESRSIFEATSHTTIDADLHIEGTAEILAGATIDGSAVLVNNSGSTLYLRDGSSVGIEVENLGTLEIGSSPGDAVVESLVQDVGGVLEMELGGLIAGTEFDQLNVVDTATLDGTLSISLDGGFVPDDWDSFEILTAGQVFGEFSSLALPSLPGRSWDVIYDINSVILQLTSPPIVMSVMGDFNSSGDLDTGDIDLLSVAIREGAAGGEFDLTGDGTIGNADHTFWVEEVFGTFLGDANLDRQVGFSDFLLLSANFSNQAGWAGGDFDGNGLSEFTDFLLLSANFGNSNTATTVTVPEPASLILLIVNAAMILQLLGAAAGPSLLN